MWYQTYIQVCLVSALCIQLVQHGNYIPNSGNNKKLKDFSILRVSANALYDCYLGIVDSFIFIH